MAVTEILQLTLVLTHMKCKGPSKAWLVPFIMAEFGFIVKCMGGGG